jgi:deoxyribonuclease-4
MSSLLGVHCSVSGGLQNAFTCAADLGIDTFQIFTRNQRQWNAKPISADEEKNFKAAMRSSKVKITFSHCSYLLNLAASDETIREKSIAALTEEVNRCTQLGLSYCIMHPGAAGSQSQEDAIKKIAEALTFVLLKTPASSVMILLEITAGQGTSVGGKFENLEHIYDRVKSKRIGYCFDTCHAFVSGYDIRTEKGMEATLKHFDKTLGLENLKVFHLNDSKGDLGSHLDRHEHIGKGKLTLAPFTYIMNRFKHVPKVLETPKENNADLMNLTVLRNLMQ